ncbi:hypothetical protein Tco_1051256 [Tanacetum coccineum]
MKTKDRPTKRKLAIDASMECEEGVVCKKQRPLSSSTLSVNGTMNAAIGGLQPPVMPSDSTCSLNHGLQVSAKATSYKLQPKSLSHEESVTGNQSCKCRKYSTPVPPIGNTSSQLVANVNYSNGHPIGEQNNCIKANIRRTSVGINVAPNVTTNGKHVSTAIEPDTVDPYAIGIPNARSIERLRFRKRKNPDSTVPYQSQRVIRQLISEKITSASRYSGNRQHTHLPNATKQIIVDDNCCKKQQLMKEKQQNFLTDKCSSLCPERIHSWRKLHACTVGTHYLNGESVSTSTRIPLEYSHLGRITLRPPPEYPQYFKELYNDAHFMDNIRAYNQMFSMTSLGANVDSLVNNGKGPYVFRVSGQIYHWIGSMCSDEGKPPRFLQLYICDTTNEVNNRLAHFRNEHGSGLKKEIVEGLIEFLDNHNAIVQLF